MDNINNYFAWLSHMSDVQTHLIKTKTDQKLRVSEALIYLYVFFLIFAVLKH